MGPQTESNGNLRHVPRCPRCGAVLSESSSRCHECELLKAFPAPPKSAQRSANIFTRVRELLEGTGIPVDQIAATIIAILWLLCVLVAAGFDAAFTGLITLVWPLAMIWFADEIGSITGFVRGHYINQETHPSLIKILGWGILLCIVGASLYGAIYS
jgi:hypothetical protein